VDESEPDRLDVALGASVRRLRRGRGMSQADLGLVLGVSFQQVQKYERGTNRISFSTLMRVCEALDCSLEELMGQMEGPAFGSGDGRPLTAPETVGALEAMTRIPSPNVRRAIVDFARALARDGAAAAREEP
jgi:DNA-binding Xre family transcriptional regulator